MQITIIAVGSKMPSWVQEGYQDYAKRFTSLYNLKLIEIPAEKRSKNSDIDRLLRREGEKMLASIIPGNRVIALDVGGKVWNTAQLAHNFQTWVEEARDINLLIGGPDGLSPACLQKAEIKWSLSPLTFPHPLVRIILAEQLYRAISIIQGHPYHRE